MSFKSYITEADQRIGKIILNQINSLDRWAMASWGSKNIIYLPDGIQMDVRGSLFRGRITIQLNKRDTYDITFGKIKKLEYIIKHTAKNIFVDQIINTIDQIVG